MRSDQFVRDSAHGMQIPTGLVLARAVHGVMLHAGRTAAEQAKWGRTGVSVDQWRESLEEASRAAIKAHYLYGQQQAALRILAAVARQIQGGKKSKSISGMVRKDLVDRGLEISWDLLQRGVLDYVRTAPMLFAASTMETASKAAANVIADVRSELGAALSQGETVREINRRMRGIFADPDRAARIGQTETSRAMHAGQLDAMIQGGITKASWLASSDACDLCLSLNGKIVNAGEPFYIHPKGGRYAVVLAPPSHPHCMCSMTEVIDDDALETVSLPELLALARGAASTGTGSRIL
jgi:hypothetical protein